MTLLKLISTIIGGFIIFCHLLHFPLQASSTSCYCWSYWWDFAWSLSHGSNTRFHKCYISCRVQANSYTGRQPRSDSLPLLVGLEVDLRFLVSNWKVTWVSAQRVWHCRSDWDVQLRMRFIINSRTSQGQSRSALGFTCFSLVLRWLSLWDLWFVMCLSHVLMV
jgi:hypothetical protein